jgi:hypothetical protein
MSKLNRFRGLTGLTGVMARMALAGTAHASPVLVSTPAALGANDSVNWAQLGLEGTTMAQSFGATSVGRKVLSGAFSAGTGYLADVGSG